MNQQRRKKASIGLVLARKAHEILTEVQEEEQDAFDNLPFSLQEGEKGEAMQAMADDLETYVGDIGQALEDLENMDDLQTGEVRTDDLHRAIVGNY